MAAASGRGAPIQLTHADGNIDFPAFSPDGKRIVYVTNSPDKPRSKIEVISTLGGDSQVLVEGGHLVNWSPMLSPDGKQLAYLEVPEAGGHVRLMTMSSTGGQPQEVQAWGRMRAPVYGRAAWTSDNRHVISLGVTKSQTSQELDWFVVPLDGSEAQSMGAADAFHELGMSVGSSPMVMAGNRALFQPDQPETGLWEVGVSPGKWRVQGNPRQLTSGTQEVEPYSATASGTLAVEVADAEADLFLLPLSFDTGQPTGAVRRLTHDQREKQMLDFVSGDPLNAYFELLVTENRHAKWRWCTINLSTGKQAVAFDGIPFEARYETISADGRQIAYSMPEGNSWSIRVAGANADLSQARVLCKECGIPYQFSPDGRFLLYAPGVQLNNDPKKNRAVHLLDVASGKDEPWIEDPSDSLRVARETGVSSGWVVLTAQANSSGPKRAYLVPWKEKAVPRSEWIAMPLADENSDVAWRASPQGDFFYGFEGTRLMAVRFDPKKRAFSEPHEVVVPTGSRTTLSQRDAMMVRAQGLVFSHEESLNPSVWLMKVPR